MSATVVYNKDVIGKRGFDFYPPKVYAETPFGDIQLDIDASDITADGINIDVDQTYDVPNTEKIADACQAIIPFYKKTLAASSVKIEVADLSKITITGGAVATAQIKAGQKVFVGANSGSSWTDVGIVGSVGASEEIIYLSTPYSTTFTGDAICIGADTIAFINYPNTLYDKTANFTSNKVAIGDIIELSSLSITGSVDIPLTATVSAIINKNTLRFNTTAYTAGHVDYNFDQYKAFTTATISTISLYSYKITRLVGFSENLGYKDAHTTAGVRVTKLTTTSFTISNAETKPVAGDIFMITSTNVVAWTNERDKTYLRLYVMDTVTNDTTNSKYIITCSDIIYLTAVESDTGFSSNNYISAWTPMLFSSIKADFRSIRSEENKVVKRIASIDDIFTAWVNPEETTIDIHNELAYMAMIAYLKSGQKATYGVNVDASSGNLAAEYGDALEELKLVDVYSHAFGTTDAGVNAIVGDYCDEQADPYEAHERIGIICYDQEDVFLMGEDDGSMSNSPMGLITIDGAIDLHAAGITVKDRAQLFDSSGDLISTVTVTSSPASATTVQTDFDDSETYGDVASIKFLSGRKDDQAVRIGALKYGNRRVSVTWPGWFYGEFNGERMLLPPYYIAATVCGMDGGVIVSQSFTNMNYSIPGISNIQLDTNQFYRKAQLDEIGGGGIDLMIQDGTITQSIKSRHDLTSNMDAVEYRERSITKQADVAAKTLRAAISPYVGRYNIGPNLFKFLGQVCSIVTTKIVKDGILNKFTVKSIAQDELIADKINIFVEATVFVAGNYYDITMLVKSR